MLVPSILGSSARLPRRFARSETTSHEFTRRVPQSDPRSNRPAHRASVEKKSTGHKNSRGVAKTRADDACEHLYILIVRSSLGPSPPNAGRYTVASRFRCRFCKRGYILQGLQNSSLPPCSAL